MSRTTKFKAALSVVCIFLASAAGAHSPSDNRVKSELRGDQRCIKSNGLPDHDMGAFPNRGNPHEVTEQDHHYCFPAKPQKNDSPRDWPHVTGIILNGVPIRPGTAESYDPSSRRGFSRHGDRRWRLEGMGNAANFGLDDNTAHVDHRGIYHYHGAPTGFTDKRQATNIGYAADGFEIHSAGPTAHSGYRLKMGQRPSGPGGAYDGRYLADWEYRPAAGDLDQCNGGMVDGKFVYFVTATYPFYPRCLWGNPSGDFEVRRREARDDFGFERRRPPRRQGRPPPRRRDF